jgi:predicted RNase H-like nuclease (RuvC/YqgF family)
MNFDFENVIFPAIISAFTGLFGWLMGKNKEKVEIQGSEITNVQEAIKIWREMAVDMKAEVAELKDKIDLLTTEVHTLRSENVELRQKLEGKPNENKRSRPKGNKPDQTQ